MEIMKFIWQDVGIRNEIKLLSAESLLHLHVVIAQSVFPRDFIALRKMINPLVLVQAFVQVALARARRPEQVPLVRLCVLKIVVFEERTHKFGFAFQDFVQHLLIVNMMASLGSILQWRTLQLLLIYRFNLLNRVECVMRGAP